MRGMIRHVRPKPRGKKKDGKKFWDTEYKHAQNLALSLNPSEDLMKFSRWLSRETGGKYLKPVASVLDLGCGNGRNLIYLAREFGCRGVGYDISGEAISQAKRISAKEKLALDFFVEDMRNPVPLLDSSQTIALDMMASHFLNKEERARFVSEISRVLRDDGWLFFKTFFREEDRHAKRLLKEHPGSEAGSYIHPKVGSEEHVFTKSEIEELLGEHFTIIKMIPSHRHIKDGHAWKRRSISVYAQKKA